MTTNLMDDKPIDAEKAAGMLVVGFVKGWPMRDVLSATRLRPTDIRHLDAEAINSQAEFLPTDKYEYMADTRTYVSRQFPKLASFLLRNLGDTQKCLSVIPQVMKLKHRSVPRTLQSKEDFRDAKSAARKAKQEYFSYRASRELFKTHRRSAWNVCKK